jgi:hypothetical protein
MNWREPDSLCWRAEMAFAKLKAHLRSAGARTYDALWCAVGHLLTVRAARMLKLPQTRRYACD